MITLRKSGIFLQYDEQRGRIRSLRDGKKEYVGEECDVFAIALLDRAGERSRTDVEGMRLRSFECAAEEGAFMEEGASVEKGRPVEEGYPVEEGGFAGTGFRAVYEGGGMSVTVSARIADCLEWRIAIDQAEDRAVEWVDFPRIAVPNDLRDSQGRSKILWGFNEGVVVDDLSFKEAEYGYKEPGYPTHPTAHLYPAIVETQFLAYYEEGSGLYFGAHDREGHLKGIDFFPYKKGIMLHMRHYCGGNFGEGIELPYAMAMRFFRGGWQDGAQIYRDWFRSQLMEGFVPIEENGRLPEWYGQSPVVVTYPVRGKYDIDVMKPNKMYPYMEAMKHIERLERELGSRLLVLLMHWEGTAPWAPPYVWPPYGGEEALKEFIHALHERGDLLGVYCSGLGWTQRSKLVEGYGREAEFEEKNLRDVMCLSPKQELPYSAVVPFIRAGYDMCPSQRFTAEVLKGQVKHMTEAGLDYIQLLDQQHGGTSYFCYSRSHGHPPVPGKWQVDAMRGLLEEIGRETGKVLLGTESAAAESYIPYLPFSDNRFQINYSVGRPVPLYAYLYHEYINNFMGNQVYAQGHIDFEKTPGNVLERLAYSFTAGDMLTVVLNEDGEIDWCWDCGQFVDSLPQQQSIKTLIRNLNRWRQGDGRKYLHTGRMEKPYPVESGQYTIHCCIRGHETAVGRVHTSAWRARDGSRGQFLVNFQTEDVVCEIRLPQGSYRLRAGEGEAFRELSGGARRIRIKALSAALLEWDGETEYGD